MKDKILLDFALLTNSGLLIQLAKDHTTCILQYSDFHRVV